MVNMTVKNLAYTDFLELFKILRPVIGHSIYNHYIKDEQGNITIYYDEITKPYEVYIFGKPGILKITEEKPIELFYELEAN